MDVRIAITATVLLVCVACNRNQSPVQDQAAMHDTTTSHVASVATSAVADSTIFPDTPDGNSARRGFAIIADPQDSVPDHVGNQLRCFSCHLNNGYGKHGMSLVGTYAMYPSYSTRDSRTISMQDRINNCFRRSLAGRDLAIDSREMRDIVAYLALISHDVPAGAEAPRIGLQPMPSLTGDTTRGAAIFSARCARCHGTNGQGIPPATPLWGAGSFSVGASLARLGRAASFIRHNMPFDSAGVLTDQQAFDVAAYIVAKPRQDSPDKGNDWRNGGAPADVPYNTNGHVASNPPKHLLPAAFR